MMENTSPAPIQDRNLFPAPEVRLAVTSHFLARIPHLALLCGGIPKTGLHAFGKVDALLTFEGERRTVQQRYLEAKYAARHFLVRVSPIRLPAIGGRRFPPLGLQFDRPQGDVSDTRLRHPTPGEILPSEAAILIPSLREIWREIDGIVDPAPDVSSHIVLLEPDEICTPDFDTALDAMIEQALTRCEPASLRLYGRQASNGVLARRFQQRGLAITPYTKDNIGYLARAREVWTCGGSAALEAILAGGTVRTFAQPLPLPAEAAALLIAASRYADPVHKERVDVHAAIDRLHNWSRLLKRHYLPGKTICIGIPKWKQPMLEAHLMAEELGFASHTASAGLQPARVAQWSYPADTPSHGIDEESAPATLFVEDGFLRSAGFGSDFHFPLSLTLDRQAMHFDGQKVSDLEMILAETRFTAADLERARQLRQAIVEGKLTKYNLPQQEPPQAPIEERQQVVLIAGQVPSDAAVLHGAGDIRTALDLVKAVRALRPDAYVVFREHPELIAGNRPGRTDAVAVAPYIDEFITQGSILHDIHRADEVHAITSLAGFEALLRNRKVVCWGRPFYAGWGLTTDMAPLPRRTRTRTVDELVAGALMAYPSYVDPNFAIHCGAADVVKILTKARDNVAGEAARQALLIGALPTGLGRLILTASSVVAGAWRYIALSCRLGRRFYWLKRSP